MKKLYGFILAGAMAVSLTACGGRMAAETTAATTTAAETTSVEETTEDSGKTLGEALLDDFKDQVSENPEATALELAEGILANDQIEFSGDAVMVEEGLLTGFGNTEITDFEEGAMFGPIISTIPFVGYVFDMEDAESAEALVEVLTENADPRWNICTEAEETVVGTAEDKVFFVMCPKSMEE